MEMKLSPKIQLSNVFKRYNIANISHTVLNDISIKIYSGEMVAVMGASGSGKSTIMNIIGCLDQPSEGQFLFDGKDISTIKETKLSELRNKSIGFVFQQFYLLPKLTVKQNVSLPLIYRGMGTKEINPLVEEKLEIVGLSNKINSYPNQLSGGQQQRVAIARSIVGDPDVILADEPTGALDSVTGQEIIKLFLKLNNKYNRTVIMVTHDPSIGQQCGRTIYIKDGHIVDKI